MTDSKAQALSAGGTTPRRLILVINPGSTSTKLALFADAGEPDSIRELYGACVSHSVKELAAYQSIAAQRPMRTEAVHEFLRQAAAALELDRLELAAVIGRGGLLAPLDGGVYLVNESMISDLESARYGEHASNLGGIIARDIARTQAGPAAGSGTPESAGCPAYIADPVVVDELAPEARYSGLPDISRRSIFHALNQKAVARRVARSLGRRYEECNFIVAHMGGGISVGAHLAGRVVDVNNALDGDGPFSPERAGGLPAGQLMERVISRYQEAGRVPALGDDIHRALKKDAVGKGGLVAYLGVNDLRSIEEMIGRGDGNARAVLEGMIHQIAGEIARHGATLRGRIDGIILTGGLAHSRLVVESLRDRLSWMADIEVLPGEGEMEALAENAAGALIGEREVRTYGQHA